MLRTLKNGLSWFTSDRKRMSLGIAVGVLGLLLWSRLIVVSNMPRTAVADDKVDTSIANAENKSSDNATGKDPQDNPSRGPSSLRLENKSEIEPKPSLDEFLLREEGKSGTQEADKPMQEVFRNRNELIRNAVQHLRLESIRLEHEEAEINGHSYTTDDRISLKNFESLHITLVEVRSQSVILMCQDRRFELRIH